MLSLFVAAVLGTAAAPPPANPLALAEKGLLQCYRPDAQKKSCQSIAAYRRTGPGTYDNKALVALAPNATLETNSPVVIKSGAVCGFVRAQDVLSGTLRVDGRIVEPDKAKPILERVVQAMAPLADKEICTRYEPSGTDWTAKASVDGTERPELEATVKWIGPSDGYTVTP